MLLTPLPGQSRESVLKALREVARGADAHRSGQNAQLCIGEYLDWATGAAAHLRHFVSASDIAALVLTPGYDRLLTAMGMPGFDAQSQRVLNGMRSLEEQQRSATFAAAIKALEGEARRWDGTGLLVVPDSSFCLMHDRKLEDTDFAALLDDTVLPVHVLFPSAVIDELDRLKETGHPLRRWRAGYSLAVVDRVLKDPGRRGVLESATPTEVSADCIRPPHGAVTLEIVFDPPGHVRGPDIDREIIERSIAIQALSGKPVTLFTYDTNMSTMARAAGLQVVKPVVELGPEPAPDTGRKKGGPVVSP